MVITIMCKFYCFAFTNCNQNISIKYSAYVFNYLSIQGLFLGKKNKHIFNFILTHNVGLLTYLQMIILKEVLSMLEVMSQLCLPEASDHKVTACPFSQM